MAHRALRTFGCAGARARFQPIENVAHAITDQAFCDAYKFGAIAACSTDLQELHADIEPCSTFFGRERLFGMKVYTDQPMCAAVQQMKFRMVSTQPVGGVPLKGRNIPLSQ